MTKHDCFGNYLKYSYLIETMTTFSCKTKIDK